MHAALAVCALATALLRTSVALDDDHSEEQFERAALGRWAAGKRGKVEPHGGYKRRLLMTRATPTRLFFRLDYNLLKVTPGFSMELLCTNGAHFVRR